MQSWRVLQTSPWVSPTSVYALATSKVGSPSRAYTLDVRVNRVPDDLKHVLGEGFAEKMAVSEIVEGLVLFEEEEHAMIYLDLADGVDGVDEVFSIKGPDAVKAIVESNGVVVVVDEPAIPQYLREKLLSIAYDISP